MADSRGTDSARADTTTADAGVDARDTDAQNPTVDFGRVVFLAGRQGCATRRVARGGEALGQFAEGSFDWLPSPWNCGAIAEPEISGYAKPVVPTDATPWARYIGRLTPQAYSVSVPGSGAQLLLFNSSDQLTLSYLSEDLDLTTISSDANRFSVSADGQLVVFRIFNRGSEEVKVVRLDGSSWPGGAGPMWEVTGPDWARSYAGVRHLTLLENSVLFVADASDAPNLPVVFRAPLDGLSRAAPITAAVPGGVHPGFAAGEEPLALFPDGTPVIREDRRAMVLPLRTRVDGVLDAYLFEEGDSDLRSLTQATDHLRWTHDRHWIFSELMSHIPHGAPGVGSGHGCFSQRAPLAALSDDGSFAYVEGGMGLWFAGPESRVPSGRLMIASADGVSLPEVVNAPGRFASEIGCFGGLHFRNDDELLFWARPVASDGTESFQNHNGDLFHFRRSTGDLTNLTESGTASVAPFGRGSRSPREAWVSTNRNWLFVTSTTDFEAPLRVDLIDLNTLARTTIADNTTNRPRWSRARESSLVWLTFAPRGGPVSGEARERAAGAAERGHIFVFDESGTLGPIQLHSTEDDGSFYIQGPSPSPDDSVLAFVARGADDDRVGVIGREGSLEFPFRAEKIDRSLRWSAESGILYFGARIEGAWNIVRLNLETSSYEATAHPEADLAFLSVLAQRDP